MNCCPFDPVALVVAEDVPIDMDHLGTVMVLVCELHLAAIEAHAHEISLTHEVTVCPVSARQEVEDALILSGHQVWEMLPAA